MNAPICEGEYDLPPTKKAINREREMSGCTQRPSEAKRTNGGRGTDGDPGVAGVVGGLHDLIGNVLLDLGHFLRIETSACGEKTVRRLLPRPLA
jgi:hypothetical protein